MSKINHLLLDWKPGDIHGQDWLKKREIGQRLAFSYYEEGYLRKVGPGVFARKADSVDRFAVVRYLQEELKLRLHISGRSALEQHGHSHYMSVSSKTKIQLTSYEEKRFPAWVKKLDPNIEFVFTKSSLLKKEDFLDTVLANGFEVKVASRELAILELIESLDLTNSLETAENYLQSLLTLRGELLQKVLLACDSVKAKRVFLYLAEKNKLPWFKHLRPKDLKLGAGKRVVVKGGQLDRKYQITVDRSFGENPF